MVWEAARQAEDDDGENRGNWRKRNEEYPSPADRVVDCTAYEGSRHETEAVRKRNDSNYRGVLRLGHYFCGDNDTHGKPTTSSHTLESTKYDSEYVSQFRAVRGDDPSGRRTAAVKSVLHRRQQRTPGKGTERQVGAVYVRKGRWTLLL